MLLQRLREYNQRVETASGATPTMYIPTLVKWLVDLDERGRLRGFVQIEGEGKRAKRGREYWLPTAARSSTKIVPKLLADRADYALGFAGLDADRKRQKRTGLLHESFRELARECAEATGLPQVRAVAKFLDGLDLERISIPTDLAPGDVVAFRVGDELPTDLASVQAFWAERHASQVAAAARGATACLVCGQVRPPAKRHRIKIKRVPGGQSAGLALVSANKRAFESYGLRASLIAPICAECAEAYAKGANRLIADERTTLVVGSLRYLFWARDDTRLSVAALLDHPEPDDVKALFQAAWTGREGAAQADLTPFYVTAFGASGGRVAVREWFETTIGDVAEHLRRYFTWQRIVRLDGSEGRPLGLYPLTRSLVQDGADVPPHIATALVNLALEGSPLPVSLLAAAAGRARAARRDDPPVTHPRAAIVKMVLLSNGLEKEGTMEALDQAFRHPAYLCGRVFAIVEAVQYAALGDVNATVADRYFGAASTSPAYVLGKLVSDARKAHFGKLRRQKPGVYHALSRRLEDAMEGLGGFPATLTLEDQGRFVLGYYHQRAADRAEARKRRELRDLALEEKSPDSGSGQEDEA